MARIAFDLDGTLFDVRDGTDYESAESVRDGVRANAQSVARVRELADAGHVFAYVTGRCEHLRALTTLQIVMAGLPAGRLVMNKAWEGYDAMADYKAAALHEMLASIYVGDHEADRKAARTACIPFLHVDEFRAGALSFTLCPPTSDMSLISDHAKAGG